MLDNLKLPNKTIDKIYDDGLHQSVAETGKIVGRIPRLINAAFAPLDCWIAKREYNVEKTKRLLEENLKNVDPEKIVPPEPYVAVPAIQAISYSMDNDELRALYANLLAKSIYADTKEAVHPAFVDIIKQLSPNDALVFKEFAKYEGPIPSATLSITMKKNGLQIFGESSMIKVSLDTIADTHLPNIPEVQQRISFDNLQRLGLILQKDIALVGEDTYSFVDSSEVYTKALREFEKTPNADRININKKCFHVTDLGQQFSSICLKGFD